MKTRYLLSASLLVLALVGCQSNSKQVVTADGTVVRTESNGDGSTVKVETTDAQGNKTEISGDESGSTVKDGKGNTTVMGKAASDADLDLPKYPGATRMADTSMVMSTANGRTMAFTYKTADPFDKVLEFYKAQLSDIKPTLFSSGGDETAFFGIKEDKRDGLISLTRKESEKETLIAISVTDKK